MEGHSFGYWLRLRRKALDLTQSALADRVGCSVGMIRKIESEERRPSAQIVERLAEVFSIPPEERMAFLRFARGDWRSTPRNEAETALWMTPAVRQPETTGSQLQLATFLFTDIENSARLWEDTPEQMKDALQRHHEVLQDVITANGGTVFQIIGDAFCAAFPTVLSAVSAAMTAQQELYREQWDLPFPIRVRMGIHTGEAERTSSDNYASGPTLNRVARILNAAHGGQLLLSLATRDLIKDSLPANTELRDMGEHYLKNLMYPERLFQLNIASLPSEFPPLNTLTHHHNLPVQVTSFIGREVEIALIHEYLLNKEIRLVTLIGPPGIGKTRLSIEAARAALGDFPDGVFFVALAPLDDPSLIASELAQALGYVSVQNISTTDQLKEGIGDKELLLALDNCEHLIEGVASLASELLSACSRLKILTTSRESLRIPGEWLYAVPAFDLPIESASLEVETASKYPALKLFVERARAVRSDFSLNADNIETVAEICARLDGLPLVIELIATRIRLMSPQALLDRLTGQFVLTADGMRAASERQKTLRNAIDWSYNLLPPEEQKLFAYLSVFSGSFTLEAVEAMLSRKITEKPLPNLIALLLDKSLLKLASDLKESSEVRYIMLVTIQEYARERLWEMGQETEIKNEHLEYFFRITEKGEKELHGPRQVEWLHRLAMTRNNLRSALEWVIETGQTEIALQMASYLSWFWSMRSEFSEGRLWLEKVVKLPDAPRYAKLYSYTLAQLALHAWLQSGPNEARPFAEQALFTARAHDDKWNIAWALSILGLVLTQESDFIRAQFAFEESRALFREVHDKWGYAYAVLGLALSAFTQGDLATSLILQEEGLVAYHQLGDNFFENAALRFIGIIQVRQGNLIRGVAALREALLIAQKLDSKHEVALALMHIGDAVQAEGDAVRAVHLYLASKNILDSIGVWRQDDEAKLEGKLTASRAKLEQSTFAHAAMRGRAMTMEQAIAHALADSSG